MFQFQYICMAPESTHQTIEYCMYPPLGAGGTMVIATWCQREETEATPFSEHEKAELQFLYDEWAHPYFVSIEEYEHLMNVRHLSSGLRKYHSSVWGYGCIPCSSCTTGECTLYCVHRGAREPHELALPF